MLFYCCSSTVVPIFPPPLSPAPPPTPNPTLTHPGCHCPWVFHTCSLMIIPLLSPLYPCSAPLATVSLLFYFNVWLYFACILTNSCLTSLWYFGLSIYKTELVIFNPNLFILLNSVDVGLTFFLFFTSIVNLSYKISICIPYISFLLITIKQKTRKEALCNRIQVPCLKNLSFSLLYPLCQEFWHTTNS